MFCELRWLDSYAHSSPNPSSPLAPAKAVAPMYHSVATAALWKGLNVPTVPEYPSGTGVGDYTLLPLYERVPSFMQAVLAL